MSIYDARDKLIAMYNGAYLATHVNEANHYRKLFTGKYGKSKSAEYVTCARSIGFAYVACYKRNRMRTFHQWNHNLDWDDSPYVKPEPFKPDKATYLYSKGRLGTRNEAIHSSKRVQF